MPQVQKPSSIITAGDPKSLRSTGMLCHSANLITSKRSLGKVLSTQHPGAVLEQCCAVENIRHHQNTHLPSCSKSGTWLTNRGAQLQPFYRKAKRQPPSRSGYFLFHPLSLFLWSLTPFLCSSSLQPRQPGRTRGAGCREGYRFPSQSPLSVFPGLQSCPGTTAAPAERGR